MSLIKDPVRFGILGCANIAKKYAIDALKRIENVKLVAIASRDWNKAKKWAEEYGCEYETYDSLLLREDINAVYIPLPVSLHEEWVIKTAKAKKHILCEKSLGGSYQEVKNMINVCKENNVLLFENFTSDYHPQHEKVISLINSGIIGEERVFSSKFCFPPFKKDNIRYKSELGGGSLNDVGAYIVFMSRKIFSEEPEAVTCKFFYGDYNVDIEGSFILEFSKGRRTLGFFGFNNMYQNKYSILGTEGMIAVNRAYSIPESMKPDVILYKQDFEKRIDVESANQFVNTFRDFVSKLLESNIKEADYEKLLRHAKVMEALRISARENRKVFLNEFD